MITNGELRLLQKTVVQAELVLDVGANVGDWTLHALGANPSLTIHCFEPSADAFKRLSSRGFPQHVILNNCGLSSTEGTGLLHVFDEASGNNSLYRRTGLEAGWGLAPQRQEERVQLRTLDRYCETAGIAHVDFMKVDVEGHEMEVFKGASSLLRQGRIGMIQFEYGGCNIDSRTLLKDFFEFFQGLDYDLYKVFPSALRPVPRYDQRLENFQHQNWVAKSRMLKGLGRASAGGRLPFSPPMPGSI
ncbi:MAG TPA: FkbM family methyltransferase [Thermoanaerobaculia bacterium]|nr:FkbM family methyltransferase [Thermoanaerobaculia bacterium]